MLKEPECIVLTPPITDVVRAIVPTIGHLLGSGIK
jgi:hypothetical protein